ncbi:MAG: class I SAM-dependent methyltransferase [Gammaproteobacteria bacterium]|nr:class I SAM-dependent methyltransferase [Gammaproteobacteria bacterium]
MGWKTLEFSWLSRFFRRMSNLASQAGTLTTAQGWDQYARSYLGAASQHLGDEWNSPESIGIDAPANRIVCHLDETVFAPFLGKPNTILEIGSGGGRFSEILLPKCRKLILSDTSSSMLKLVRRRFSGVDKVEFLLLDGLGLSGLSDQSVDAAFSYDVFIHMQHWDIYRYLCELRRVIKPGGKAIVQHTNTFSQLGWKRFLMEVPDSLNRHKPWWTFTLMTPDIMTEFIQRAGLTLDRCITDVVARDCIFLIRAP